MSDNKADIEADMSADIDRGETVSMMEPMLISGSSRYRDGLADLAVELASKSTGLRKSLPDPIVTALAFPATLASRWTPGLFPDKE